MCTHIIAFVFFVIFFSISFGLIVKLSDISANTGFAPTLDMQDTEV